MKVLITMVFSLILSGCASTDKRSNSDLRGAPPDLNKPTATQESLINVDFESLHRSLGLDRSSDRLGYIEKDFNTCDVGYGYSSNQDCHREFFVSIYFQLLCRKSNGTLSETLEKRDMFPLSDQLARWSIKKASGEARLDGQGYGQIKRTFAKSQRGQRLKINIGNESLYMKADEITRVVAPQDWCL